MTTSEERRANLLSRAREADAKAELYKANPDVSGTWRTIAESFRHLARLSGPSSAGSADILSGK